MFLPLTVLVLFVLDIDRASLHPTNQTDAIGCYILGTNETAWKLIWEDTFDSPGYSAAQWNAGHEPEKCNGKITEFGQQSCTVAHNVRYERGLLMLQAQREHYLKHSYTSGTLTSNRTLTKGRWEIRAALPTGAHIGASIYSYFPKATYWHEMGELDLVADVQGGELIRGACFQNSTLATACEWAKKKVNKTEKDDFHLYGIEWKEESVRFIYDNEYSKRIVLDNATRAISQHPHLQLNLVVGGNMFRSPFPLNFEELDWQCPALIVDYIRLFELIPMNSIFNDSRMCPDAAARNATFTRDELCAELMDKMTGGFITQVGSFTKRYWVPIIIIGLLMTFLAILICLVLQFRKIKSRVKAKLEKEQIEKELKAMEAYDEADEYYEAMDDFDHKYECYDRKKSLHGYVEITAPGMNQYVQEPSARLDQPIDDYETLSPVAANYDTLSPETNYYASMRRSQLTFGKISETEMQKSLEQINKSTPNLLENDFQLLNRELANIKLSMSDLTNIMDKRLN